MTDEQLELEIKKISESVEELANTKKPLTKQESRRRYSLALQKDALLAVKEARKRHSWNEEVRHLAIHSLVKSMGDRHPLLLHLALVKFRTRLF